MHCRKFNSIRASDVYFMSMADAAVGNLMCLKIAVILTVGFSDFNAAF